MTLSQNPFLQRRQLASRLRDLRQRAGMSIDDVTEHLMCSAAKISRMETGHRPASPRDVRDLCQLYGVGDEERERLITLARSSRQRAWWESYDLPTSYSTYIGFESAAVSMVGFRSSIVPGFFQTEEYAASLIASHFATVDPLAVDRLTAARMQRQEALFSRETLPTIHMVLDEAVLRRAVGGPAVMGDQLQRLLDLTELPEITVQVIPFSVGGHAAVETTFTILSMADEKVAPVVHVEDVFGAMQISDIERPNLIFDRARAAALDPAESERLITEVRQEFLAQLPAAPHGGEPSEQ